MSDVPAFQRHYGGAAMYRVDLEAQHGRVKEFVHWLLLQGEEAVIYWLGEPVARVTAFEPAAAPEIEHPARPDEEEWHPSPAEMWVRR
jgi:hypothetical protein